MPQIGGLNRNAVGHGIGKGDTQLDRIGSRAREGTDDLETRPGIRVPEHAEGYERPFALVGQ